MLFQSLILSTSVLRGAGFFGSAGTTRFVSLRTHPRTGPPERLRETNPAGTERRPVASPGGRGLGPPLSPFGIGGTGGDRGHSLHRAAPAWRRFARLRR